MIKSLKLITIAIATVRCTEGFSIFNTTCDDFAKHLNSIDYSIIRRIEKEGLNEALVHNDRTESLKELIQKYNEELWDVLILIRKGEKLGLQTRDRLVLCGGPQYGKTLNCVRKSNSSWSHLVGVVNETATLWTAISTQRHYPTYPAYACNDNYVRYFAKE